MASRLQMFFEERAEDDLHSIITYEANSHEIVYVREVVAEQYALEELFKSIHTSRLDSLTCPRYEGTFSYEHGEHTCLVQALSTPWR